MWRRMAVLLAGLALAGVPVGSASATPASGFTVTTITGARSYVTPRGTFPAVFAIQFITIAPGGTLGWHNHPGWTTVFVQQGEGTLYHENCSSHHYSAGSSFSQSPQDIHVFRNEGSTPLVVIAHYPLLPVGAPIRIDQAQPAGCSVL